MTSAHVTLSRPGRIPAAPLHGRAHQPRTTGRHRLRHTPDPAIRWLLAIPALWPILGAVAHVVTP